MLVDRLEAIINGGFRVPMTGRVTIDEREALDVLDLMRTAIPDEIKQARRISQEREKILSQAQAESQRLVTQAQDRVERLASQDSVTQAAEQRAREIVDQAHQEADDVRQGADDYALDMLERLEREVRRVHGSVRTAINAMSAQPAYEGDEEEIEAR